MPPSQRTVIAAGLAGAALLLAACAASDPPPTSPFDDTSTPPVATGTQRPLPTFTPTAGADSTATPDAEAEMERVTGEAISRLAEWTGEPETDFVLIEAEAVDWPSACLGVEIPGQLCAEVITPGYRVEIGHAGQPNPPYVVHASRDGRYAWMAHMETVTLIEEVDEAQGVIRLQPTSGSDEMGREHRVVPGSYLEVALTDLQPGTRVHIAVTWPLPDQQLPLIVWLVPVAQ